MTVSLHKSVTKPASKPEPAYDGPALVRLGKGVDLERRYGLCDWCDKPGAWVKYDEDGALMTACDTHRTFD